MIAKPQIALIDDAAGSTWCPLKIGTLVLPSAHRIIPRNTARALSNTIDGTRRGSA